jgi:hypothetical protein
VRLPFLYCNLGEKAGRNAEERKESGWLLKEGDLRSMGWHGRETVPERAVGRRCQNEGLAVVFT